MSPPRAGQRRPTKRPLQHQADIISEPIEWPLASHDPTTSTTAGGTFLASCCLPRYLDTSSLIHLLRDASRHSDQRRVQWPSRALHDTDHTTLFTSRRTHRGRQSPALSASVVRHSSYDSGLKQRQETRVLAKTHDPSQEQPHSAHRLVPIEYLSIKEKREKGPARQKTARGTWQLPRPQWDNPQVTAPRQKNNSIGSSTHTRAVRDQRKSSLPPPPPFSPVTAASPLILY